MSPLSRLMRLAQAGATWLARRQAVTQAVVGAIALGLGFWGWSLRHPAAGWDGVLNNVFRTLQLITLQFPTSFEGSLPWQLQIARLALPVVAVLATLHVLIGAVTRPMRLALLPLAKEHVLVCGVEALTLDALKALAKEGQRKIVVVAATMDPARRETLEGLGLTVAERDLRQPELFEGLNLPKAAAVFLTGEDEVANLNLAVLAMKAARGRPAEFPPLELAVLVDREDLAQEMDAALDAMARAAKVQYHRLCPDREGLRLELQCFAPVFRKRQPSDLDRRSHVLVVGLHGHWEQVLAQLILACQDHPEQTPLLTLVLDEAEAAALAEWRAARPQLPLVAEIAVLPRGASLLPEKAPLAGPLPPDLAVVLRPDAQALAAALALRRLGLDISAPVLVRQSREDRVLSHLGDAKGKGGETGGRLSKVVAFGGMIRHETIARVLDRKGEELAMALHEAYREKMGAPPEGSPQFVDPWEKLPENARDANRAAADHAAILLAAAGLRSADEVQLDAEAKAKLRAVEMVERLARIEHRRWMAERIGSGWRHGKPRDNDLRFHPSLCPYDFLEEAEREKDRQAVLKLIALLPDKGRGSAVRA